MFTFTNLFHSKAGRLSIALSGGLALCLMLLLLVRPV